MSWLCTLTVLAIHGLAWWLALGGFDLGAGDDLAYWRSAHAWRAGEFTGHEAAWSPVFVACNLLAVYWSEWLAEWFGLDTVHGVQWLSLAVGGSSAVAVAFCARAVAPAWVAVAAGAWWSGCWFQFAFGLNVLLMQTLLWGFAVGFLLRGRPLLALPWILLAVVDRAEGLLWLGCITAAAWWGPVVRQDFGRLRRRVFLAVTVLLVAWIALTPGRSSRAWLAFGQHYGLTLRQRMGGELRLDGVRLDPWVDWQRVVEVRFGDVKSPLQAARREPAEVFRHVAHNATGLPRAFRKGLLWPFGWARGIAAVLFAGLLGCIGYCLWRRRGREPPDGPRPSLRLAWVSWCSLGVLAVPLGLHPRSEFFAAYAGLVMAWLAVSVRGSEGFDPGERRRIAGVAAVAMVILVVVVSWKRRGEAAACPNRDGWQLLVRHLDPEAEAVIVGSGVSAAVGWAVRPSWAAVDVANGSSEEWRTSIERVVTSGDGRQKFVLLPWLQANGPGLPGVREELLRRGATVLAAAGTLELVRLH